MNQFTKQVLAVVAHPDDEIIGVGGTLCKHRDAGNEVSVLMLGKGKSSREYNNTHTEKEMEEQALRETQEALNVLDINNYYQEHFPDNRFDSVDMLDIAKIVSSYVKNIQPSVVYTHHGGDLNVDHQRTSEAVSIACRPIENSSVEEIFHFETLSSTEMAGYQANRIFTPNYFVDIKEQMQRKLEAMDYYKSELHDFPHPRSLEAIRFNAKTWGAKINREYAEPFFSLRQIK